MNFLKVQWLILICGIISVDCQAKDTPWPEIAKTDLDYIKKMVEENHPGYIDPGNPQFKKQLERSYQNVIGQLKYVQSVDAVMNLDNEFVASFADDHFVVNLRFVPNRKLWAGIKIERRHEKYLVTKISDNWPVSLPALGAELISCDDRSVNDIMNVAILRYRFANYTDEFPRTMFASKLFIDDGIGYRKLVKECVFRDQAAHESSFSISWQSAESVSAEWDASRNNYNHTDFYIEPIGKSVLWVRVPTFLFATEEGLAFEKLKTITRALADMKLKNDKIIVLDVRGNNGGDSMLGVRLLEAAVGKAVFWTLLSEANQNGRKPDLFRTSRDNLEQIRKLISGLQSDAASHNVFVELAKAMEQDLKNKQLFTQQPDINNEITATDIQSLSGIRKSLPHIVLVTDHFCASSCLDFVMDAHVIPNLLHVGEETYADTEYNNPLRLFNPIELPSKLGFFYYPSKIAGQRGPFKPIKTFDGDMNDTNAVKDWVTNLPQLQQTSTQHP